MTVYSMWLDEIFQSLYYSSVVYRYLNIDLKKMHGRDAVCKMMWNPVVMLDLPKRKNSHLSGGKLLRPTPKLISVGPLSCLFIF